MMSILGIICISDEAYERKAGQPMWPLDDRLPLQLAVWHLVDDCIHAGYDRFFVVALPGLAYDFAEYAMRQRNAEFCSNFNGKGIEVHGLIPEEYELNIEMAKLMAGFNERHIIKGFLDDQTVYNELTGVADDLLIIDINPEDTSIARLAAEEEYTVIPCSVDSLINKAKASMCGRA